MLQVKLPYYPKITATATETRFGVMEISHPQIYETPIQGRVIVKLDTLKCLEDLLGKECFVSRVFIYSILAGSSNKYDVNELLASFYRRYPTVTKYVNEKYNYGDNEVPLFDRCVLPLRREVDEYGENMYNLLSGLGGKFLVKTHDILYFAYKNGDEVSRVKGVELIC